MNIGLVEVGDKSGRQARVNAQQRATHKRRRCDVVDDVKDLLVNVALVNKTQEELDETAALRAPSPT